MSIVLELTPEEETTIRFAAEAKGQDVSAFLKSLALATARKLNWAAAGEAATQEARTRLHSKGIVVVYEKSGIVVEELPDGTIRPFEKAA